MAGSAFGDTGTTGRNAESRDRTIREPRTGGAPDPNKAQPVAQVHVTLQLDRDVLEKKMVSIWNRVGEFRDTVSSELTGTAPSYQ